MTTIQVELNRPQTRAFRALQPGHTVAIPWGRGVGKSWFIRRSWYLLVAEHDGRPRPGAQHQRGVRIVLLMPTFKHCVDVHGALLSAELEGQWAFLGGKLNRSRWRVDFPGGSWIQFFGAKEADAARGLRCDAATVDEADDIDPEVIDGIVNPWFSEPWSLGVKLIGGTPLRGRYGLLYRSHKALDAAGKPLPRHVSVHATYRDAPETVSAEYVERIRAETPPEVFRREWECDFDAAEGLVYDLFRESFHVRACDPRAVFSEVIVGADWGYEDPFALVAVGVLGSGQDAVLHVVREVYQSHKTAPEIVDIARSWKTLYPQARWFADPSQPAMIELLRREAGLRIQGADNAIDDGIAAVAARLLVRQRHDGSEWSRLFVDPSCTSLIREFGLYRRKRDPRNKERVLDSIEDRNNHALDALRYAIFSRFGRPPATRISDDPGW